MGKEEDDRIEQSIVGALCGVVATQDEKKTLTEKITVHIIFGKL